jgi:eukaryotic-like serine/threonine-protein kinase
VVWLALLGFPVALALAWAFDASGGTIRRTAEPEAAPSSPDGVGNVRAAEPPAEWLGRRALVLASVFVLLGAGMSAGWVLRPDGPGATRAAPWPASEVSQPTPAMRFRLALPDTLDFYNVAVSPDGERLLLQTRDMTYLYSTADMKLTPMPLPGALTLMGFSPDGRRVWTVADRSLRTVALDGSGERVLADSVTSAQWTEPDAIFVIRRVQGRDVFARVAVSTGREEQLYLAEDSLRRTGLVAVTGGRGLLFTIQHAAERRYEVGVLDVRRRRVRMLPPDATMKGSPVAYFPTGHVLLYGTTLDALPFDARSLEPAGAPFRLLPGTVGVSYAAGMLAYTMSPEWGPMLVDRRGQRRELPGATDAMTWVQGTALSPAGDRIALWRYESSGDEWHVYTYALPAGPLTRISADSSRINARPAFSPDGRYVYFVIRPAEGSRVVRAPADGSGAVEPVQLPVQHPERVEPLPDGRFVVVDAQLGLVVVDPADSEAPATLVPARYAPSATAVSPDGRWVAYTSREIGAENVFVRPIAGGPSRWQISRTGGDSPAWGRDLPGAELFYTSRDSLYRVPVQAGTTFEAGPAGNVLGLGRVERFGYNVLPRGEGFLMIGSEGGRSGVVEVIINYLQEVRALAAGRR